MPFTSTKYLHLGLTGWPLEHSLSPQIHTAALRATRLAGDYRLFPIPPLPRGAVALEDLITYMRRENLNGLNVTIPFKQAVIPFLDDLTPVARATGAVNTIFRHGERIIGDNTDVDGFLTDLKVIVAQRFGEDWFQTPQPERHALILGAGGAACAIAYALARTGGWRIHVAARRVEQVEELATRIQNSFRPDDGFDLPLFYILKLDPIEMGDRLSSISLIVNAIPVGMFPKGEANPWPAGLPFPQHAVVYDLVYNPVETALVRAAIAAGLTASTGLGMLIEQACLSFERWTGRTAPRTEMLQAARKALKSA